MHSAEPANLAFGVVASHSAPHALLRVSLPIYGGDSGGGLFSLDGALLGIVTSNASLRVGGPARVGGIPPLSDAALLKVSDAQPPPQLLPTLNFSVAGHALRRLCAAARGAGGEGGGKHALLAACVALDARDKVVERAWALQEPQPEGGWVKEMPRSRL